MARVYVVESGDYEFDENGTCSDVTVNATAFNALAVGGAATIVVNGETHAATKAESVSGPKAILAADGSVALAEDGEGAYVMEGSVFAPAGTFTIAVYYDDGEEPTRFVPNTTLDEVMNIAIANGYEGEYPKNIADAVAALGIVMGGGGSGGDGGYIYDVAPADLVHQQTINVIDQEGHYYSPIIIDTQACASIDMSQGVNAVCVIDGTEYVARVSASDGQDGAVSYFFQMDYAGIQPDSSGGYEFYVSDLNIIPLGEHVIHVYYEGAFKKPFIDAIKNEMNNSGVGSLIVNMTLDSENPNKWTLDKNCSEIYDAYTSGKRVIFNNSNDLNDLPIALGNITYMYRPSWSVQQFNFELFEVVSITGNSALRRNAYTVQSNTMTRTMENYTLTPASN